MYILIILLGSQFIWSAVMLLLEMDRLILVLPAKQIQQEKFIQKTYLGHVQFYAWLLIINIAKSFLFQETESCLSCIRLSFLVMKREINYTDESRDNNPSFQGIIIASLWIVVDSPHCFF